MEPKDQAFDQGLKHILENPPPGLPNEAAMETMYAAAYRRGSRGNLGMAPGIVGSSDRDSPIIRIYLFIPTSTHRKKSKYMI